MGQGGAAATASLNLFTFDNAANAGSCSIIATDMGSYGNTFKINLKTAGGTITTGQFTALFIDSTGNISCCSNLSTAGIIYANGDKLNFPNLINQYKINLYGTNSYGFGIAADTLQYSRQNYHKF